MQLSFWDLYSLFDKEYNSVIKEAAEKARRKQAVRPVSRNLRNIRTSAEAAVPAE